MPPVLAGVVGLAATLMATVLLNRAENELQFARFENTAVEHAKKVQSTIETSLAGLQAIHSFYNASDFVSRDEFREFVTPLLALHPGMLAVGSARTIARTDREQFVDSVRGDGVADFDILEHGESGNLVVAPGRQEYFPIVYVEPWDQLKGFCGWDLGSESVRRTALDRARESGSLSITAGIELISDRQSGIIVFLPRKEVDANTGEQTTSFVIGVYRVRDLLDSALSFEASATVSVELMDVTNDAHSQGSLAKYAEGSNDTHWPLRAVSEFLIGGRTWRIVCTPTHALLDDRRIAQTWAIAGLGLLLTLLSVGYLVSSGGRTQRIASEVRRQTAALRLARAEADRANDAKSQFLANISHELRTPMTAILGFSEMLMDDDDLSPELARTTASRILRNGEHLLELLNEVLDLSKIEAGKLTITAEPCDAKEVIQQVAELMSVRAEAKSVRLEVVFENELPLTVTTDELRIRQMVSNLLSNAIKFTTIGSVTLHARYVADSDQPMIEVDVRDTGIGLSQEQADRLFQPFTQADEGIAHRYGGTGLGLSISRQLARLLGGDVYIVESIPESGSLFRMSISASTCTWSDKSGPQSVRSSVDRPKRSALVRLDGLHVLLAEDGEDNQRLITTILSRAGATVEIAANGAVGVEIAQRSLENGPAFDVVLMDVQMPEMDGIEATRILREANYTVPIIAVTASAMQGDRERLLSLGFDDYAQKPVQLRILLQTIARVVGASKSSTDTADTAKITDLV